MEIFEVDLRDRETGNSKVCIYSGDDHDKAYTIAEAYNSFSVNTELIAEVYHCERPEQIHGVGNWNDNRKKKYKVVFETVIYVEAENEEKATEIADKKWSDGEFELYSYIEEV